MEHAPVSMELVARDDGSYFSRTYQVSGREEGAITLLSVSVDGLAEDGFVEWRRREVEPVESVTFDSASYSVRDGFHRVARLLAPWDMVAGSDLTPRIDLHGDPSITLVSQAPLFFGYDDTLQAGVCPIRIRGSGSGAKARLTATVGEEVAEAEIRVTTAGGLRDQD